MIKRRRWLCRIEIALRLCFWQGEGERNHAVSVRVQNEVAAVGAGDFPRKAEAEAGTGGGAGFFNPMKSLEEQGPILVGNGGAAVGQREADGVFILLQRK